MAELSNYKESLGYRNQLIKILDEITVESVDKKVGTLNYLLKKYDADFIRILNKETNRIHFINPESLKNERLKYYFMDFSAFFIEIERVGYTYLFDED
jgi:hypothetical protein